jgi:hypothetical protein
MKNIFTTVLFCLAMNALAQNNVTKKDTATYEFGERIFDARIGRYMSVDPKATHTYALADSAATKPKVHKHRKIRKRKK